MATTLPPRAVAFSQAYRATFPEPETTTVAPAKERPAARSMLSAK